MNEPRTRPYRFRVFEFDGYAWLYDDSERTYPCTATPHVYAEVLYPTTEETEHEADRWDWPDPIYLTASRVPTSTSVPIDIGPEVEEQEAWDDAREVAIEEAYYSMAVLST